VERLFRLVRIGRKLVRFPHAVGRLFRLQDALDNGRWEEAAELVSSLHRIGYADSTTYLYLAYAKAQSGQWGEAIRWFQRVQPDKISSASERDIYCNWYAYVLDAAGLSDEARSHLERHSSLCSSRAALWARDYLERGRGDGSTPETASPDFRVLH
jgi:tetratricopeptide (TPR) repeat protein